MSKYQESLKRYQKMRNAERAGDPAFARLVDFLTWLDAHHPLAPPCAVLDMSDEPVPLSYAVYGRALRGQGQGEHKEFDTVVTVLFPDSEDSPIRITVLDTDGHDDGQIGGESAPRAMYIWSVHSVQELDEYDPDFWVRASACPESARQDPDTVARAQEIAQAVFGASEEGIDQELEGVCRTLLSALELLEHVTSMPGAELKAERLDEMQQMLHKGVMAVALIVHSEQDPPYLKPLVQGVLKIRDLLKKAGRPVDDSLFHVAGIGDVKLEVVQAALDTDSITAEDRIKFFAEEFPQLLEKVRNGEIEATSSKVYAGRRTLIAARQEVARLESEGKLREAETVQRGVGALETYITELIGQYEKTSEFRESLDRLEAALAPLEADAQPGGSREFDTPYKVYLAIVRRAMRDLPGFYGLPPALMETNSSVDVANRYYLVFVELPMAELGADDFDMVVIRTDVETAEVSACRTGIDTSPARQKPFWGPTVLSVEDVENLDPAIWAGKAPDPEA